jgi:protein SCO1/2
MTRSQILAGTTVVAIVAVTFGIVAALLLPQPVPSEPGTVQTTMGTAEVGGPFKLMDQTGAAVSDRDFRGRMPIIYFGWTNDLDLTPAALQVLMVALKMAANDRFAPLFITLDPEVDTPSVLERFLKKYDARLRGLTGSPEEIAAVIASYKLYAKRIPDPSLPNGHSIDHASLYYVLGKDGAFRAAIPHTTDVAELVGELAKYRD